MNENKESKRRAIMVNEAYELLFGDRMRNAVHKKKKKKIIKKKEENSFITPSKPQNDINLGNNKNITKPENKKIINEEVNKIKDNNFFPKSHQFLGNKRINLEHKNEYKEKEDKNKIIKTKIETYKPNTLVKKANYEHKDNKIKYKMDYSPTKDYYKVKPIIKNDIPKEKLIIKKNNNDNNSNSKYSSEKKSLEEKNKIKDRDMHIKREYTPKNEPIKKLNNISSSIKLNSSINHPHYSNNSSNIKPKNIIIKNNETKIKNKEINMHSKIINHSLIKKEYKEDKDIHNNHNKNIHSKDNNLDNNIKLKSNLNKENNINEIQKKENKIIKLHNQNNINITKSKEITKNNNINNIHKSNQEKMHKILDKPNPNKNLNNNNNKITQIKPNLINKHSSNPEKNKLNSNQKIKPKQPIISHKNNINDKNKLINNNFKRPDNIKPLSHKINQIPHKNNINSNPNKISHHSEESKIDKIKKALENRRIGNSKYISPDKINNNNNYLYNYNKPKHISSKRDFFENSDYDENDSFIDDTNYQDENYKEVMGVLNKFKSYQDKKKETEYKGDIIVSNYDRIQEEEERTRRIGKQEDLQALIENREREDSQEESDEEDEY